MVFDFYLFFSTYCLMKSVKIAVAVVSCLFAIIWSSVLNCLSILMVKFTVSIVVIPPCFLVMC